MAFFRFRANLRDAQNKELQEARRNANMYHMIKARRGEAQISKRKRVIARVAPAKPAIPFRRPDFLARLKRLYRSRTLKVSGAEIVSRDRDRE